MNKCNENLQQIKQKVIEKLKEDKLYYNPDIEEDKKFRKFFAMKTVPLENATEQNIADYSQCIYRTIKSYLADQEIKGTISFKVYGLENLRDRYSFADLIRGIFYYQPVATNYDKIKNMSLDSMAAQFATMVIRILTISANQLNEKIGALTPELPSEDKIELFNSFKEWLMQNAEEEPKAKQKIKRSECEGIDCAWCGEDCK